jgi:hypothetical protein
MAKQEVEELSQRLNVKGNKAPAQPTIAALVGWLTSARGKKLHQEATAALSQDGMVSIKCAEKNY